MTGGLFGPSVPCLPLGALFLIPFGDCQFLLKSISVNKAQQEIAHYLLREVAFTHNNPAHRFIDWKSLGSHICWLLTSPIPSVWSDWQWTEQYKQKVNGPVSVEWATLSGYLPCPSTPCNGGTVAAVTWWVGEWEGKREKDISNTTDQLVSLQTPGLE